MTDVIILKRFFQELLLVAVKWQVMRKGSAQQWDYAGLLLVGTLFMYVLNLSTSKIEEKE